MSTSYDIERVMGDQVDGLSPEEVGQELYRVLSYRLTTCANDEERQGFFDLRSGVTRALSQITDRKRKAVQNGRT